MKNHLKFIVYFFMFYNSSLLLAQTQTCGIVGTPTIDECCATITVTAPLGSNTWDCKMLDGTYEYSSSHPSNTFTHCYNAIGDYDIVLTYYDNIGNPLCGAGTRIEIEELCADTCAYHLCWEEVLANSCLMDTVKSITLMIAGVETVFNFSAPIEGTGNYQDIVDEILDILYGLGWTGTFKSYAGDINEDFLCTKGMDIIPGFTFFDSTIPILRINGVKVCNSVASDTYKDFFHICDF